jgi:hypothetical protein
MNTEAEDSDVRHAPAARMPIYATGKLRPHFPDVSIEREIRHAAHHLLTDGRVPEVRLHEVLSKPENRYLARKVLWFFDLDCGGAVLLRSSDPTDVGLFTKPLQARASVRNTFEAVVGIMGSAAGGETAPMPAVICDQIMSVSLSILVDTLVAPKDVPEAVFRKDSLSLARQLLECANRYGLSDQQRALTFLMLRNSIAYDRFTHHRLTGQRLVHISAQGSPRTSPRKVMEVGFVYEHDGGAMERDAIRIDVTQEFPFVADSSLE